MWKVFHYTITISVVRLEFMNTVTVFTALTNLQCKVWIRLYTGGEGRGEGQGGSLGWDVQALFPL